MRARLAVGAGCGRWPTGAGTGPRVGSMGPDSIVYEDYSGMARDLIARPPYHGTPIRRRGHLTFTARTPPTDRISGSLFRLPLLSSELGGIVWPCFGTPTSRPRGGADRRVEMASTITPGASRTFGR